MPRYLQLSSSEEERDKFLIEVEDAVQRHLNMKLSDLNRKAGSKYDDVPADAEGEPPSKKMKLAGPSEDDNQK